MVYLRRVFLILVLAGISGAALPARAINNPVFIFPQDDQTIDYEGAYLFALEAVPDAQAYYWEFFQNDARVWSELKFGNERPALEYGISNGTPVHSLFQPGDIQVQVRAQVGAAWTDATRITIHLQPRGGVTSNVSALTTSGECASTLTTFDQPGESYEVIRGTVSVNGLNQSGVSQETFPYYEPADMGALYVGKAVDVRVPSRCSNLETVAFDLYYDREPSAIFIRINVLDALGRLLYSVEETVDPGSGVWHPYTYALSVSDAAAVRVYAGIGAPDSSQEYLGYVWLDNVQLNYCDGLCGE